mmetsp:Transcript_89471/g.239858  ORF Transcript_89471/g.239858 Transcript_89471/m.239858 type:complete len:146 (-) Transcript_89471:48-485(-)
MIFVLTQTRVLKKFCNGCIVLCWPLAKRVRHPMPLCPTQCLASLMGVPQLSSTSRCLFARSAGRVLACQCDGEQAILTTMTSESRRMFMVDQSDEAPGELVGSRVWRVVTVRDMWRLILGLTPSSSPEEDAPSLIRQHRRLQTGA